MRLIRNFAGALVVAGLASLAYAAGPSASAAPLNTHALFSAAQQDQTAPPKPEDKDKQDANRPKDDKQQPTTRQQQADKDKDQQRDKSQPMQARQDQRQDQHQQGGSHGRISDRDYQAHFSRAHSFTVRTVVTTTRIVPNQTRFVYGGYNFVFLQPWPAGWALTDDCYIDYINGEYVLIDLAHPGVMLTLSIVG